MHIHVRKIWMSKKKLFNFNAWSGHQNKMLGQWQMSTPPRWSGLFELIDWLGSLFMNVLENSQKQQTSWLFLQNMSGYMKA